MTQNLNKETSIRAANGRSYPALTVFAHALRFFHEHAVEELSDQSATTIVSDDIRWVITVPAIWKAPAKQFMRLAAYQVSSVTLQYNYKITSRHAALRWDCLYPPARPSALVISHAAGVTSRFWLARRRSSPLFRPAAGLRSPPAARLST